MEKENIKEKMAEKAIAWAEAGGELEDIARWVVDAEACEDEVRAYEPKTSKQAEIKTALVALLSPPIVVSGPMLLGAKMIDGRAFKPDAQPDKPGRCGRCGKPGYWISGAGEYLCHRHQNDY